MIKEGDYNPEDDADKESQRTTRMKKLTESLEVNGPKAFKPQQGDGTPVRPFNPFKKARQGEETPVQFKAAQNAICSVKQPFI